MRSVGGLSATSLRECSTAERHLKVFERCVPCHGILLLYFPPTRSVTTIHHDLPNTPMRKITHQKERCTPVEPALASQREKERERECITPAQQWFPLLSERADNWSPVFGNLPAKKDRADVVEAWHWLGRAVNGHTNGLVFLSLLTLQLRSLSMSKTHTQEWPQRSRVNQTHCAHGKRNRKHLDSQCALNVDEAALYVAALGGWQQAECGRHVFHCLPIA